MLIRYMSLGEIVMPNIGKTVSTCVSVIVGKKTGSNPQEIAAAIGSVLRANMKLIEDFKHSDVSEDEFDTKMIGAIENATGIKLTVEEFNNIWNSGNPSFPQFEKLLNETIAFNNQLNQKIVFISGTNIKDLRHLQAQLDEFNKDKSDADRISYKTENDMLFEIGGIRLITTCATKKPKAAMLANEVKHIRQSPFNSTPDIKYICGTNDIKDPMLMPIKDVIDQNNQQIKENINIDIMVWDKRINPTFNTLLSNEQSIAKPYAIPMQ